MAKPKALGYLRVSTDEQASKGGGLGIQRRAIEEYCKSNAIALVDVLSDEGISGSNGLDSRNGLATALAQIERHEADVIIVYRLDRLARDLMLQETTIARLRAAGASVVSVTEPDVDSDEPTRVLVRQVLGAIGQYERAVIRGRMRAGRQAKAAQGRYVGGIPRFGYSASEGELVADRAEQAVIERVRMLHRDGLSLRAIAEQLEADGLRPKRGERWHPAQVSRVLQRPGSAQQPSLT